MRSIWGVPSTKVVFWIGIIIGTAVNLAFVWQFRDVLAPYNIEIDSRGYQQIALRMVSSGDWTIPITHPPGYLFFLAIVYRCFGVVPIVVKLVFVALLTLVAVLTGRYTTKQVGPLEGCLAAWLVIFSTLTRAYAATLQYEVLALTLTFLSFIAIVTAAKVHNRGRRIAACVAAGFIAAASLLCRETFIFPLVIFLTTVALAEDRSWRERAEAVISIALPVCLLTVSWIWFQYDLTGKVVFISDKGDINFAIGNNPKASGTFNLLAAPIADPRGWEFIQTQPLAATWLVGRKAMYFFGLLRDGWNVPLWWSPLVARLTFGFVDLVDVDYFARALLPLFAIFGTFLLWRDAKLRFNRELRLLPTVILATSFPYLLMISSVRFLIPVLPFLAILAAIGIVHLARNVNRLARAVKGFVAAALLGWSTVAVFVPSVGRYTPSMNSVDGHSISYADATLIAPPTQESRQIAIVPDEIFSRGPFSLEFVVKQDNVVAQSDGAPNNDKLGDVFFLDSAGGKFCAQPLELSPTVSRVSIPCALPYLTSVKPVVTTNEGIGVTLSDLSIHYALDDFSAEHLQKITTNRPILGWGWSRGETLPKIGFARWSVSQHSQLLFAVSEPQTVIDIATVSTATSSPTRTTVLLNGSKLGEFVAEKGKEVKVSFGPIQTPSDSVALLELRHQYSLRPADDGRFSKGKGDSRDLAVLYTLVAANGENLIRK